MGKATSDTLVLDPSKISHFVVDWDETVTTLDTMHLLGAAAYEYHDSKNSISTEETQQQAAKPLDDTIENAEGKESTENGDDADECNGFQPRWDYFVRGFLDDYSKYSRAFVPDSSKSALEQEIDFLNGLRPVEYESARRVERIGLFKGVPMEHITRQAKKVMYRSGWWDLISKFHPGDSAKEQQDSDTKYPSIVILSVNWSGELIKKAIDLHFPGNKIRVFSNKIDFETGKMIQNDKESEIPSDATGSASETASASTSTTAIGVNPKLSATETLNSLGDIRTAADKKLVIQLLKQEEAERPSAAGHHQADTQAQEERRQVWYFGDSSTDTMALVEADKGVVVGKKKTFDRLSKELKIPNLAFISDWTMVKLVKSGESNL